MISEGLAKDGRRRSLALRFGTVLEQVHNMLGNLGRWGFAVIILAGAVSPALAQSNWAEDMISPKKLDFGVIATGSEAIKVVSIQNRTSATLHISSTSTACRCAEASSPGKDALQPGESTTIEVRMNTRSFKQQRDTSLTIQFDSPQFAEVRIPITAYIRTDVVFEPGKVDFGKREFLAGGTTKVSIAYAGRPDWQIRDIKITNPDLKYKLQEKSRNGGNVTYELEMSLAPQASPGRIRDMITLVTDDATNPYVPLLVEGTIVPDITISNPNIAIRALKPGQTTTVKVVMQGNKPFLVEDVDCRKMDDCFKVKMSEKENTLQVVEMEFTAPDKPGKFAEEMIVKVKGRPEVLKFTVSGNITGG